MKKSDLSAGVAAESSLSRADAEAAVNAVLASIGDALAKGETVSIAGFGIFSMKDRPARQGREHRDRRFEGAVVQGREGASGRRALAAVSVRGGEPMAVKVVTMAGVDTALEEFRALDSMPCSRITVGVLPPAGTSR